jgi:hypothetical protein
VKPTELYLYDVVVKDGKEMEVTGIRRLRPSQDPYKKPGAERYFIDLSYNGIIQGGSYWSDEDVAEWPEDYVHDENEAMEDFLLDLHRDYDCPGCGAFVEVKPGYDDKTNHYYAEVCAACPNCGEVTDF